MRIYNLNGSEKIKIDFNNAMQRQGEISFSTDNGENFEGEYLFQSNFTRNAKKDLIGPFASEGQFLADNEKRSKEKFSSLYGFGEESNAKPVGTMILIGDNGTVIDVVFYTFSFDKGTASGVGKDNKGNVYRIFTTNYYE